MARFARLREFGRNAIEVLRELNRPGVYIPAETSRNPDGTTTIHNEEVVIPQGPLRSTTIRAGIAGVSSGLTIIGTGWAAHDPLVVLEGVATVIFSGVAVWRHIRSWMPVKGMAPPVPTGTHSEEGA